MKLKPAVKRRMETLAKFIESVPPVTFNMDTFVSVEDGFHPDLVSSDNMDECGATFCIAGWEVIRNGLYIKAEGDTVHTLAGISVMDYAANSLGLTFSQAMKLFQPLCWPTTKDQRAQHPYSMFPNTPAGGANRIRYFIKTGK